MRSVNSPQLLVVHRRLAKDSRSNPLHFLSAPKGTDAGFWQKKKIQIQEDVGMLISRPEEGVKEVTLFWVEVGGKDTLFEVIVGSLNHFLGAFPNLIIFCAQCF